ncbi:MAG: PleD family two-component system response regulator [Phycisphaerae bacterium]|nr:response regulator [Tepidisphaeraceae bacterium]
MPTVLVVDDVADARHLMSRVLKHSGFDTLSAASGEEALRLARERRPAVMLLDVDMPGMDGFEVLGAVKQADDLRDIAVIMLTAMSGEHYRAKARALGAEDYFVKASFKLADMLARIREHAA